jgi:hypothetical protein
MHSVTYFGGGVIRIKQGCFRNISISRNSLRNYFTIPFNYEPATISSMLRSIERGCCVKSDPTRMTRRYARRRSSPPTGSPPWGRRSKTMPTCSRMFVLVREYMWCCFCERLIGITILRRSTRYGYLSFRELPMLSRYSINLSLQLLNSIMSKCKSLNIFDRVFHG